MAVARRPNYAEGGPVLARPSAVRRDLPMSFRTGLIGSVTLALAGLAPAAPPNAGPLPDPVGKAVTRSIERGVAGLRTLQNPDGTFGSKYGLGGTALAALALLECGVRP